MILGIDFDGTLVDHAYPDIGEALPGAFDWLKKFQALGARLVLFTMRCDGESCGPVLTQAVDFCRQQGVEFWAVNDNPDQAKWTGSRKVYCHAYIDDAAVGCPLKENPRAGGRPYVDWSRVGPLVEAMLVARRNS